MPPVIGDGGVVEEIRLDHPVHLQMLEMVGDALEESLADVSVVFGRLRLPVIHRVASLWPTAVSRARPVILIVGVADRELTVERVIDSEEPGPHVYLVVVVRVPAKAVLPQRVAVQRRNVLN